jgi:hypothetical protein
MYFISDGLIVSFNDFSSNVINVQKIGRTCGLVSLHCCPTKYMDLLQRLLPIVEIMTPRENTSLDELTGFPHNTSGAM